MPSVYLLTEEAVDELCERVSWWIETNKGSVVQSDCPRREGLRNKVEEVFLMMVVDGTIIIAKEVEDAKDDS